MVLEMTYPQLERAVNPTHDIKLFSGRSNPALAQEIADYLGTTVGPMVIKNFADGEIYVQVKESIRGDDVFIIQPLCNPVNENLMELLIMITPLPGAGPGRGKTGRVHTDRAHTGLICGLMRESPRAIGRKPDRKQDRRRFHPQKDRDGFRFLPVYSWQRALWCFFCISGCLWRSGGFCCHMRSELS